MTEEIVRDGKSSMESHGLFFEGKSAGIQKTLGVSAGVPGHVFFFRANGKFKYSS